MAKMTFFRPKTEFLAWLRAYARGRPAFDVGCGNGEFLTRMWDAGIKAMGVDKYADEIADMRVRMRTLCQDAITCKTLKTYPGLVLFCRPNHTGWVADTIATNLHPDSEVLYISKPGNHFVDLPDFRVEELDAPGLEVEAVWKVLKPYPRFGRPNYLLAGLARTLAMRQGNDLIGDD